MNERFRDRLEAGRQLAALLAAYSRSRDVLVLGLARGGVPVAYAVARELGVPLDVFVVRKLGFPGHEELAMGAIASGGVRVLNRDVIGRLCGAEASLEEVTARESVELERRERAYRAGRDPLDLREKAVIVVDDGLATGATMRAAVAALRQLAVTKIVVAAPVGAKGTCAVLRDEVDELVCLLMPEDFYSVGQYYEDFSQTTDDHVRVLLAKAAAEKRPEERPGL